MEPNARYIIKKFFKKTTTATAKQKQNKEISKESSEIWTSITGVTFERKRKEMYLEGWRKRHSSDPAFMETDGAADDDGDTDDDRSNTTMLA